MQETCVLNFLPSVPQWKIYYLPSMKQVEYSLILKQKEELQSLVAIATYSKNLKISSCTILDKQVCLSEKNKIIKVVFLNNVIRNNLLDLKFVVHETYVRKQCNNFLIFIKNIHKDVKYQVQNNNIYIKCDNEVQWTIFYTLFEFLLARNGRSIIGASFYNSFVCHFMMINEKCSCIFLCTNNNNGLQIPLCEKREINLEFTNSRSAQRFLKNNVIDGKNNERCRINVNNSSQKLFNDFSSIRMKRKLMINEREDITYMKKMQKIGHCFCEKISCKCHYSEWKFFRKFSKYSISNYVDLLLSKGVISGQEFNSKQNSRLDVSDSPFVLQTATVSLSNGNVKLHVNNIVKECNLEEKDNMWENNISQNVQYCQNEDQQIVGLTSKENSNCELTEISTEKEENKFTVAPDASVNQSKFMHYQNKEKENVSFLCEDFFSYGASDTEVELETFQTAAGRKVVISESAMQVAKKMFAEVFQCDKNPFPETKNFKSEKLKSDIKSNKLITNDFVGENIDKALAEKIFEEISFDDKEIESSSTVLSLSSVSAEKTRNKTSFGKTRKSLGGRRSLKPYST